MSVYKEKAPTFMLGVCVRVHKMEFYQVAPKLGLKPYPDPTTLGSFASGKIGTQSTLTDSLFPHVVLGT